MILTASKMSRSCSRTVDTGGAEQLGNLCLDEIVLRPGVSFDDHVVDADAHRSNDSRRCTDYIRSRSAADRNVFTAAAINQGTISFGAGFFLVLIGWPFLGMLLEAYGFVVLFSGFWPTLVVFLQRIPIIGWIFQQLFVTPFLDRYRGKRVPV
ncbi:Vesicle transport protein GOT1 [Zea mays]|nr:Vesicle transport protein GOT1 [Zea mays]